MDERQPPSTSFLFLADSQRVTQHKAGSKMSRLILQSESFAPPITNPYLACIDEDDTPVLVTKEDKW